MNLTEKKINTDEMDREVAILVIDGVLYEAYNHQEALEDARKNYFTDLGIDLDCYEDFEKACSITHKMFQDNEAHGFSLYVDYDRKTETETKYIISHFEENFKSCEELIRNYAKENDCILGTFLDESNYQCGTAVVVE